ncbi:MAG: flagellar basal-body MS-ring/collar protein FliF, partial [Gammaproteobacteria bacterium]
MASFKEMFDSNSSATKNGLVIGFIVIVLVTLAAGYWLLSASYAVLFKDLEQQDAAAVVSELESQDIPYKLENGGRTVLVPEENVHRVRLQLMETEARLIGGIGFELFDNSDFGMTEFVQKINYQRALQGELTRTITSLDEIKYARVHLVMPESSLFKDNQKTASASITLFVNDGDKIKSKQVAGIQRLVASSVPGMELSSVIVANQNGVVLSRETSDEADSTTVSYRLRMRKEIESYLTDKATKMLERTFGSNQALVSVDVALNLDKVKTTLENIIPSHEEKNGIVKKRETTKKTDKTNDNVTTEVEYRLGRKVDQVVTTPGSISHLSVGVLVPRDTSARRVMQIEELVSMAVGIDKARGDEIVVHAVALPQAKADTPMEDIGNNQKTSFKTYIDQQLIDKAFTNGNVINGSAYPSVDGQPNGATHNGNTVKGVTGTPQQSPASLQFINELQTDGLSLDELKYLVFVKYKELMIAGLVGLAIFILIIAGLRAARRSGSLSSAEREEMLKQLRA